MSSSSSSTSASSSALDLPILEKSLRAALQLGHAGFFTSVATRLTRADMPSATRRTILNRCYLVARLRLGRDSRCSNDANHDEGNGEGDDAVVIRNHVVPAGSAADVMWSMRHALMSFVGGSKAPGGSLTSFCAKLLYKVFKCLHLRALAVDAKDTRVLQQFVSLLGYGCGDGAHLPCACGCGEDRAALRTLQCMRQHVPFVLQDLRAADDAEDSPYTGAGAQLCAHLFAFAAQSRQPALLLFVSHLSVFVSCEFSREVSLCFADWRARAGDEVVDAAEGMVRDFFAIAENN